jgi:hypothetical protein
LGFKSSRKALVIEGGGDALSSIRFLANDQRLDLFPPHVIDNQILGNSSRAVPGFGQRNETVEEFLNREVAICYYPMRVSIFDPVVRLRVMVT